MRKNKVISMLVCVVMIFSILNMTMVSANSGGSIASGSSNIHGDGSGSSGGGGGTTIPAGQNLRLVASPIYNGKNFTVDVFLDSPISTASVSGFDIKAIYDTNKLEYVSATKGSEFVGANFISSKQVSDTGNKTYAWMFYENGKTKVNVSDSVKLGTITFKAKANVGETVSLEINKTVDDSISTIVTIDENDVPREFLFGIPEFNKVVSGANIVFNKPVINTAVQAGGNLTVNATISRSDSEVSDMALKCIVAAYDKDEALCGYKIVELANKAAYASPINVVMPVLGTATKTKVMLWENTTVFAPLSKSAEKAVTK
ncbi:MAG: cohesin domain-containing protein [Oscillospiraceae bacterium]